jgi:hypothetical protein
MPRWHFVLVGFVFALAGSAFWRLRRLNAKSRRLGTRFTRQQSDSERLRSDIEARER